MQKEGFTENMEGKERESLIHKGTHTNKEYDSGNRCHGLAYTGLGSSNGHRVDFFAFQIPALSWYPTAQV